MKHSIVIVLALSLFAFGGFAQKRTVKSAISLEGNTFLIRNAKSGKCLDIPGYAHQASRDNGASVELWDLDDGSDRKVKFVPAGDGFYHIRFQHATMNLDVHGCYKGKLFCGTYKDQNGAKAQIWSAGGSDPQKWRIEQVRPGVFKIINKYSNKVLDADNNNVYKNGCKVQIWDYNGEDQQLWEIVDVATGTRYQQ